MSSALQRATKIPVDDRLVGEVERMAALGLTQEQVSSVLGISPRTLRNYKRDNPRLDAAYKKGRAKGLAYVATSLRGLIEQGNVAAIIFYLKTQGGWSTTHKHEIGVPDDVPAHERGVDPDLLESARVCREYMVERQRELAERFGGHDDAGQ